MPRSKLEGVWWMNLDRRRDRAATHQAALQDADLQDFAERISAVDGRTIRLQSLPSSILTVEGRQQALNPPDFVLGRVLTPGAVGLWMTWHNILTRIMKEASPCDCFLVVEDDAEYCSDIGPALFTLMENLDACDPLWDACAVGYIRSKTRLHTFSELGHGSGPDDVLMIPSKLCGATAILVHGPSGARSMMDSLFPVDADNQFDLKITLAIHAEGNSLRMYAAACPLATAPLSEAGDTDIQSIPDSMWSELKQEAAYRHMGGDMIAAQAGVELTAGTAASEEELREELRELRCLDEGVPQLRKLNGELNAVRQQLQLCQNSDPGLTQAAADLQLKLEYALQNRQEILYLAQSYRARKKGLQTKKSNPAPFCHA